MDKYHGAILNDINDNLPRETSDAFEYVAINGLTLYEIAEAGITDSEYNDIMGEA